tara:strand:- start:36 stop:752 length:717 start_codon:yes stop_codon:yes gene_type:complete
VKGIILAGGTGSRLYPLTKVTNKHLLPIGSHPMIHYPIYSLVNAGVKDIMVITGTDHMGDMITLLGSGSDYDCQFTYKVQDEPDGIAGALKLCANFVGDDRCVVILGDNIFEESLSSHVKSFEKSNKKAKLFFTTVEDPERYGVGVFAEDESLLRIQEKPKRPKSNQACVGIYMYSSEVFDAIKRVGKSRRGEYEITSINNFFCKSGDAEYVSLKKRWVDAGTLDAYHNTNRVIYESE